MTRTVVIAGVGPGLGASLAEKFAEEGCRVALFARTTDFIQGLARDFPDPGEGLAVRTDLRDVDAIRQGFATVREEFGPIDVLVNNAGTASRQGLLETSVEEFERAWEVGTRGAFIASQEAASDMMETDGGTIIFTGATSSVRSTGKAIGFTARKFAARGMAMDIAQEYGRKNIHVAHIVIDGQIDNPPTRERLPDRPPNTFVDPDRMAETYWQLVDQDQVDTMPFEVHITNGPRTTEFI